MTFLLLFGVFALTNNAQGQLTFSRAIAIHLHGPGGPNINLVQDTTITVPLGKVWKIESVAIGAISSNITQEGVHYTPPEAWCYVTLDRTVIAPPLDQHPGLHISPIWLPAGNYSLQLWEQWSASATDQLALVSILEFGM